MLKKHSEQYWFQYSGGKERKIMKKKEQERKIMKKKEKERKIMKKKDERK